MYVLSSVGALVSNQEATDRVVAWLESNEMAVRKVSKFGEYIEVEGTVRQWETMLNMRMHEYAHTKDIKALKNKQYMDEVEDLIGVEAMEITSKLYVLYFLPWRP